MIAVGLITLTASKKLFTSRDQSEQNPPDYCLSHKLCPERQRTHTRLLDCSCESQSMWRKKKLVNIFVLMYRFLLMFRVFRGDLSSDGHLAKLTKILWLHFTAHNLRSNTQSYFSTIYYYSFYISVLNVKCSVFFYFAHAIYFNITIWLFNFYFS